MCLDCHLLGRSHRNVRLYTCIGVGGCLQDKGHLRFHARDLRQFERGIVTELLCQRCDEKASAKDRRLMKQWRTSKQQKCKCGLPIHAENCFLWWAGAGPRPYRGMDALNRQEYEWLRRRSKI